MFFLYQTIITITLVFSPLIILFRILKKKEDKKRYKEKFCFPSKERINGNLIWFHGSSVGELLSILPLIQELEKNKSINQILITTSTLSSAQIFKKFNFKKTVHQFFPIDSVFFSYKFLNYWKPTIAIFVESEIWPSIFKVLNKKNTPLLLLNARVTKKTFNKWNYIKNFSNSVFKNISKAYPQNSETLNYLKKLNVSKIKIIGNLKFINNERDKLIKLDTTLLKNLKNRKIWCASSTHKYEEKFCGIVHKELKKKHKDILTIIIPRHVERTASIKNELNKLNLKVHIHEPIKKINPNTDIYIVNSYGKTKSFYHMCKNIFLGGSLIKHGGQNPLEATRYGCNILHGPNVDNFKEIYKYLNNIKISSTIQNHSQTVKKLNKLLNKKNNSKKIQDKLNNIGKEILYNTYKKINQFLDNAI